MRKYPLFHYVVESDITIDECFFIIESE